MKLMIASDIHGAARYCRELLRAMDAEQPDRLVLLGDILYHGPRNALPEEYDPKAVAAMLNARANDLACVRGNCDTEVDQMVLEFPVMADYCLLFAGKRMIFATHGHHYHMKQLPALHKGDILLHGHTHVPAWQPFGQENFYFNPGSVSIPKENSARGYMILQEDCAVWKDLDGRVLHTEAL